MKKILITVLLTLTAVSALQAQYHVDTDGRKVLVTGKDGEQIIHMVSGPQNKISLEVLGFKVELGTKQKRSKAVDIIMDLSDVISGDVYQNVGTNAHISTLEIGWNYIPNDVDYYLYGAENAGFMKRSDLRSFSAAVPFFTLAMNIDPSGTMSFTTGLVAKADFLTLNKHYTLDRQDGKVIPVGIDDPDKWSAMMFANLRVPFLVNFNLRHDVFFSIGFGLDFVNGFVVSPQYKSGSFYIDPVQVAFIVKVGWKNIYLFANGQLTDVFTDGRGPVFRYSTFGLGFDF